MEATPTGLFQELRRLAGGLVIDIFQPWAKAMIPVLGGSAGGENARFRRRHAAIDNVRAKDGLNLS